MDGEGTEDGRAVYREEEGDKTQEIAEAAQTITQGESSSCKEEVKFDALISILCRGSGTEHELLERIGTTISISALHAKYKNLEDARLIVYDLAQKRKWWRGPYFRYRRVIVNAYRSAVQAYRKILTICYVEDILAQRQCDSEDSCIQYGCPCDICADATFIGTYPFSELEDNDGQKE